MSKIGSIYIKWDSERLYKIEKKKYNISSSTKYKKIKKLGKKTEN